MNLNGLAGSHHAPHRRSRGRRVALAGFASGAQALPDQVGVDSVTSSFYAGKKALIVGGAGFIGSHFTDYLLSKPELAGVTLYDNFTSGREWHYQQHAKDPRLSIVRGNVEELPQLTAALAGHDLVIHLASNPDIAKAMTEPDIDFWQGTALTHSVVEGMRRAGVKQILYASGSGVYGELGEHAAAEDYGPMIPVSTYGASKLAGEALIASYAAMFGLRGSAFRFGNVVGPRQTHGVGFDFARRLLKDPTRLDILGDGSQSKSESPLVNVRSTVWEKPMEGYVKLNTDGSRLDTGIIKAGGVIRGSRGEWIIGFSKLLGIGNVLVAEAWAMFMGLKLAWYYGYGGVQVETDSTELCCQLNKDEPTMAAVIPIINQCKNMIARNWVCVTKHINREANGLADVMAKMYASTSSIILYDIPPLATRNILYMDCTNE